MAADLFFLLGPVDAEADRELDREIAKILAREEAERRRLEYKLRRSYWAALQFRGKALADLARTPAVRREVGHLLPQDPELADTLRDSDAKALRALKTCNERLGWPFHPDPTSKPSIVAQLLDGATETVLKYRELQDWDNSSPRRLWRWILIPILLIYLAATQGPLSLYLLLLLPGWPLGILATGAISAVLRSVFGTSTLARFTRATIAGAIGSGFYALPFLLAFPGWEPPEILFLAFAVGGAVLGHVLQLDDKLYRGGLFGAT